MPAQFILIHYVSHIFVQFCINKKYNQSKSIIQKKITKIIIYLIIKNFISCVQTYFLIFTQSYLYFQRNSKSLRNQLADYDENTDVGDEDIPDNGEMRGLGVNNEYLGSYYDFLINEGSYKFWAVFQVRFDN